jgi:citrate synthase
MSGDAWQTAVTSIAPNEICVRGYRIDELMGRISYGEAVYLVLKGDLPGAAAGRVIEAVLVSSIDHGVTPPSTLAVRRSMRVSPRARSRSTAITVGRWKAA